MRCYSVCPNLSRAISSGILNIGVDMNFEIKNIRKSYGKKTPLVDVGFYAEGSRCVGILGKNGTGKSTLLSILAGTQKCDGGEFLLDGENLFRNPKKLTEIVGYVPQGTPLLEELSARDNLLLWYDRKTLKRELEGGVLKMLGIDEFIGVPVRKMSGGMKKRLSIGCSVAKNPKLLLLDEPCAALDLVCKQSINEYLTKFKKEGGTLILATHDESELSLCDSIYILKDGILHAYDYDGDIDRLARML